MHTHVIVPPTNIEAGIDVRNQLRDLMSLDKRLSQARVAKEVGFSAAVLSQWLSGVYPGDNGTVETKVMRWIDITQAARAQSDAMPSAPAYVETPSSQRVIDALRYAQVAGDMAVIYGGAGLGKTTGIVQYRKTAPNVFLGTMTPASASVVTALEVIARALGIEASQGGASKLHDAIVRKLLGTGGLLVIDEAQHLSTPALDQIRSIHDATGLGIALVGNEEVYARMTGGNRAAYLDRLFSRVGKKVRLVKSTQADIDAMLSAWKIDDATCRTQLIEIASKPGGLRILTKVLRLGSMYATAAVRAVCCDDIRAAWRELGGVE